MRPVRVGMVGAGFAAAFHLRSYRQVQGVPVEIVALASRTRSRAEGLAGRFGIPTVHDDYRQLLDDPSIGVIDLCVPNALHLSMVLETAKAGKHVICEKPLTGYFGQGEPEAEVGATPKRAMLEKVRADLAEAGRVMAEHPVKFCYQDFMEAVAFNRPPLSGLELAKQVVEVVYAGYVSMEEGRKVTVSAAA